MGGSVVGTRSGCRRRPLPRRGGVRRRCVRHREPRQAGRSRVGSRLSCLFPGSPSGDRRGLRHGQPRGGRVANVRHPARGVRRDRACWPTLRRTGRDSAARTRRQGHPVLRLLGPGRRPPPTSGRHHGCSLPLIAGRTVVGRGRAPRFAFQRARRSSERPGISSGQVATKAPTTRRRFQGRAIATPSVPPGSCRTWSASGGSRVSAANHAWRRSRSGPESDRAARRIFE